MTSLTSTKALVLSLTIGLAQTAAAEAFAEAFNDRGEDFLTQVQPGLQSPIAGMVAASPGHFNDRSGDFPAHLQSGPRAPQLTGAVASNHFNDRSDTDRSLAPAVTDTASLTAGMERSAPVVRTTAAGS